MQDKLSNTQKAGILTLRNIPGEMIVWLKNRASVEDRTMSAVVRRLIEKEMKR